MRVCTRVVTAKKERKLRSRASAGCHPPPVLRGDIIYRHPRAGESDLVDHAPQANGDSYVGPPMRAIEAERYITGRAQYVDDILLPDMLHVAFLGSPDATLRAVDPSAAQGRP